MNGNLSLHIVLQKPPANLDYGLQKGSGSNYETVQTQRSTLQDLHFHLGIQIKGDRQKDGEPGFTGPFDQGIPSQKFIYIDIGAYAGQAGAWGGRLKIPLTGITWEMIDELQTNSTKVLETHVAGTGKNGAPNCATVKPFYGWKVTEASI